MKRILLGTLVVLLVSGLASYAQTTPDVSEPETTEQPAPAPLDQSGEQDAPVQFEGGTFTITQTPEGDKALAYDGEELARNYVVYFDNVIDLNGTKVALFDVGDGGNQCGPATIIAWKALDGGLKTETVGLDCGAPPAAATSDSLYFVPYLTPGASAPVQVWTPAAGLRVSGLMSFSPQPGTSWNELSADKLSSIVDAFDNEAVYRAAEKLLGTSLSDFATGLLTGSEVKTGAGSIIYGSGCVPHSCGSADAFMAIDPGRRKLYLAQGEAASQPSAWPPLKAWPADLRSAMEAAIIPRQ